MIDFCPFRKKTEVRQVKRKVTLGTSILSPNQASLSLPNCASHAHGSSGSVTAKLLDEIMRLPLPA